MSNTGFRTTVSCNKREVFTVNGQWFLTEDVRTSEGIREALVVTKKEPGKPWLKLHYFKENDRIELFPGVFVTYLDIAKRSRVRLRIEVDEGVTISRGYPRQQTKERVFIPVSQVPGLSHLVS